VRREENKKRKKTEGIKKRLRIKKPREQKGQINFIWGLIGEKLSLGA
jgi:hypothetical protein